MKLFAAYLRSSLMKKKENNNYNNNNNKNPTETAAQSFLKQGYSKFT